MNQIITKIICLFLLLSVFSLMPPMVEAQFGVGGVAPGTDPTVPITGAGNPGGPVVPFDGGMSLMLLASGVSYCAKKLRRVKQ